VDGLGACGGTARKVCDALMRAYQNRRRRTPIWIRLTLEEARELRVEAEIAAHASDDVPELKRLGDKLDTLLADPERTQA